MTHAEFEIHFAEQAEKFGIAKVIRESGEDYAFQGFMLAMSSIVVMNEPKSLDEDRLEELAKANALRYWNRNKPNYSTWGRITCAKSYKDGYKQAWEEKQ